MIQHTAPLQIWTGAEGSAHFLELAGVAADEVRLHAMLHPRGFGSVRVECAIGGICWRTSLFPRKEGGYFLPVKAEICRRANIAVGDTVGVSLRLV